MADLLKKSTTLTFDATTVAAIEKLKDGLGASSVAEVIQKALGLASLAIQNADANNVLKLGETGKETEIDLKA